MSSTKVLPLSRAWCGWYSAPAVSQRRAKTTEPSEPELCCRFTNVNDMWVNIKKIPSPSCLPDNSTLHFFENGVTPAWEDSANTNGGRWMFSLEKSDSSLNTIWENLGLALFGGTLDNDEAVTGIVIARRRAYIRISIWTKHRENTTINLKIGNFIKGLLKLKRLEYQDHGSEYTTYRHVL